LVPWDITSTNIVASCGSKRIREKTIGRIEREKMSIYKLPFEPLRKLVIFYQTHV
jgi:hypothetical protein